MSASAVDRFRNPSPVRFSDAAVPSPPRSAIITFAEFDPGASARSWQHGSPNNPGNAHNWNSLAYRRCPNRCTLQRFGAFHAIDGSSMSWRRIVEDFDVDRSVACPRFRQLETVTSTVLLNGFGSPVSTHQQTGAPAVMTNVSSGVHVVCRHRHGQSLVNRSSSRRTRRCLA